MIRVGRCLYANDGSRTDPQFENFETILVLMKSHSIYYTLSPYYIKDAKDRIFENYWQFSKVYDNVPYSVQRKSRYDNTVIWSHPAESHTYLENNEKKINNKYLIWRNKGMATKEAIRYPATFNGRKNCIGALPYKIENGQEIIDTSKYLNYIESRKEIYVKEYCKLVKHEPLFQELKRKLASGVNLLIAEVDGPHQETLNYYKTKYNVNDDFIQQHTVLINQENIRILLNDDKHPFGHGYCLAMALLDKEEEWNV
ncbi:hypothetical protein Hokovirus_4_38 [Hokovirus HKV1]|uniref:Uncharacterized protein n=1 Tax=Hokovirus HKV1 TaxID=1977638 RepID=A0A1V0SHF0_9VIRU|nr:hypothetical protein Hokovirus_4_38 [Hokovirus HKV1]